MKIDRLVSMILTLLEKERIGAQELAELFEVSQRTIYRDIEAINMAGIPIRSVPGVGGGFEILQSYKLDKQVFSTSDLCNILTGLSSLSNMVRGNEITNAFAKVRSFIPADKAQEIELQTNQICIDITPWMGNKNLQPAIETIKTALQDHRLLTFSYTAHHGKTSVRTIEPYQLILKQSHWYVYGYCHERNDYRVFKLSRITNLQSLKEAFLPRKFQKPDWDFEEVKKTLQVEITLRIHRSILDRVLEYCSYEHMKPDGKDYFLVRFPFIENDYHYHMLLGFGEACECLGPSSVRSEMQRRLQLMATMYKD